MIDTDQSFPQPTGANIRNALQKLVASTDPGDVLVLHFSGHGTQVPAESGHAADDKEEECIVPTDMNLLTGQQNLLSSQYCMLALFAECLLGTGALLKSSQIQSQESYTHVYVPLSFDKSYYIIIVNIIIWNHTYMEFPS